MTDLVPRIDHSPTWVGSLRRHFSDLRDTSHGGDAISRPDKEAKFRGSAELLAPHAHEVLQELNDGLLLGNGQVQDSGLSQHADGGLQRIWSLTWQQQADGGLDPVRLIAFYGGGFHHPHLRGGTVGDWPLNVFDAEQAAAQRPVLAAIAEADLHNLMFQADFRLIPAVTAHARREGLGFIR